MLVKRFHYSSKPSRLLRRTAGMLSLIATLAACQTTTVTATPAAQTATSPNVASETANSASDLQMDLSGRHEYLLDNGLKVIIKEDHRAPVAMTQIWYRVGSTDEPVDKGGISHLLDIPARPDKPKRRDRPTIAARSASVRPHAAASRTVQTGMCRRSTAGFSVASRALAACRC